MNIKRICTKTIITECSECEKQLQPGVMFTVITLDGGRLCIYLCNVCTEDMRDSIANLPYPSS